METLQTRFAEIGVHLGKTFREREAEISALTLSALTGHHVVMLGPPGTGKSALARAFAACFDGARFFDTLLSKFSTEDELCGAVDILALKAGTVRRNTVGMMPDTEFAFLDEVFKSNASALNAMLGILSDRVYRGTTCPLRCAVAASNEYPEDASLDALWDRFLIRSQVEYLKGERAWCDIVGKPPTRMRNGKGQFMSKITLEELDAARAAIQEIEIPDSILRELFALNAKLRAEGISVSDRRWVWLGDILRASAWLDGDTEVTRDQIPALECGLWSKPEDQPKVRAILASMDRSQVQKAIAVADEALRAYANRPADPHEYAEQLPRIVNTITEAGKAIKAMAADMTERQKRRLAPRMDELREAHGQLKKDLAAQYGL